MAEDLNSLRTLLMLYETRSVTAAAERLNVSQPTVSYTLARLRPEHYARLKRMRLAPAVRGLLEALLPSGGLAAQEGVA